MATEFFFKSWPEFFFMVFMVIGIITALFAPSAVISYIIIFISGMIAGRIMYWRKDKLSTAYLSIFMGFLIGYVIGVYQGDKKVIVILFILGAFLSYYLYNKKVLRDTLF